MSNNNATKQNTKSKGKYSPNGKKSNKKYSNFKDKSRTGDVGCDVGASAPNNPMWYAPNSQLLKDAASIPFSALQGLGPDLWTSKYTALNDVPFPGYCVLNYTHSLGCGTQASDAPTLSARYIYSFVRHANSGSRNYEAPDLYMYIMAWCSVAAVITELKRMYGTMKAFIPRNRFYPASIIAGMGGDFSQLQGTLPQLRSLINLYVAKMNALKIPKDLPLYKRWQQLAGEYYVDGKSTKAQLYIPKLYTCLKWEQSLLQTGSALSFYNVYQGYTSLGDVQGVLEDLTAPIFANEDTGIMSGDILKSYGDSGCEQIPYLEEDYVCLPTMSDEMLMQIHNAEFMGIPEYDEHHLHAWQDANGAILSEVAASEDQGIDPMNGIYSSDWRRYMLDMYKADPTPEDVMVATRWALPPTRDPELTYENDRVRALDLTGSEVMLFAQIGHQIEANHDNEDPWFTDLQIRGNVVFRSDVQNNAISSDVCAALELSAFDWAPIILLVSSQDDGNFEARTVPLTNIENYTFVSRDVIRRMNSIAMLNQLGNTVYTPFR